MHGHFNQNYNSFHFFILIFHLSLFPIKYIVCPSSRFFFSFKIMSALKLQTVASLLLGMIIMQKSILAFTAKASFRKPLINGLKPCRVSSTSCKSVSSDVDSSDVSDPTDGNQPVNGVGSPSTGGKYEKKYRYSAALESVGLSINDMKQVSNLPEKRTLSANDVFCNRELKFSGISAIGFDMDYTLAQYQQPAFDQLAFDGAKEKLVNKLGYPKEVLDFQYDHTVSCDKS